MKLRAILAESVVPVEIEYTLADEEADTSTTLYVTANVDSYSDMYGTGDSPSGVEVMDIRVETEDGTPVELSKLSKYDQERIHEKLRRAAYNDASDSYEGSDPDR